MEPAFEVEQRLLNIRVVNTGAEKSGRSTGGWSTQDRLRLANGGSPCAGRVEVYHDEKWGTVDDRSWDKLDAAVVCKELDCGTALSATVLAHFGAGSGPIVTYNVKCRGNESALRDCESMPWGDYSQSGFYHAYEAGVICSDPAHLPLMYKCTQTTSLLQIKQKVYDQIWLNCTNATTPFLPQLHSPPNPRADVLKNNRLRLANGGSPCAGRVEVYHDEKWGTVDDRSWDKLDAAVVCKELDCGTALSATVLAHFGAGSGPIVTYNVKCRGHESALRDCQSMPWGDYSQSGFYHAYEAGVICSDNFLYKMPMVKFGKGDRINTCHCVKKTIHHQSITLFGGNSSCSGRVELQRDYKSGTICDFDWDLQDADVLCRQLDCGLALSTGPGGQLGEETGLIWKTTFNCVGNESRMWDCPLSFWDKFSCTHDHDVTVVCSGKDWHLRLENGGSRCDGRVEIYHDGTWGRLLDDSWNISDAAVICRQQNCGSVISIYNSSQYGEGTGPVWINNVQCTGTETHIWKCPHSTVASPSRSSRDVGVLCSEDISIRLMDGGSSCAGRVEIYYKGTWGTVCDDSWGSLEAEVACKQLGCGSAVNTTAAAPCGRASGQVWLDEVRCTGNESALWECATSPWGQHDCHHKEDVSIVCTGHRMLRLVNGQHSCEGRVEVFYNETWGTVCSDVMGMELMGLEAAEVICKQLNCGRALDVDYDGTFGKGSGPIWLDDIMCNSNEYFLWQCLSPPWGEHNCDHSEDVGVVCSGQELRLVGGSSICSGRVEILSNNTWGTVCDDSWDIREASVVCRQLDCGPAVRAVGQAGFGQGAGQIWLDELHCRGSESFLWDCVISSVGQSDCVHKEDAGVVCTAQLISIPFVACIVLGILLALVLFALIAQMDSNSSERGSNDSTREPEYYTGECANGSDLEQGNSEVFLSNDDGHLQEDDDAESGTFQVPEQDGHHTDSDPLFAVDTSQCGYDYLDVDCDNDTEQERQLPIGNQRESPELCTV
ncbi:deleted in malignant brain tumors 1 protein-like [Callorhinchus milii]|uniref:deleted in malignant brain tumors 1 protein-like n=1 Tax=Callorhinchus milii TaxID=7868 RepID=UPI001C3F53BC|nr:deleted in malignant brain tumors 1 protein-like [Callorhinchus milii]